MAQAAQRGARIWRRALLESLAMVFTSNRFSKNSRTLQSPYATIIALVNAKSNTKRRDMHEWNDFHDLHATGAAIALLFASGTAAFLRL